MLWWTLRQLKADDWKEREVAAKKLGDLQDARSVEALVSALKDTNARVRHAVVGALVRIGHPAVRQLVPALKSKNKDTREAAAAALAKIGGPAVMPLASAIHDHDLAVRETTAATLGEIGSDAAMAQLLAALEHGDAGVKESAAAGLVRLGPKAIPSLIANLSDKKNRVRETAAAALARIGRPAIEPLIRALQEKVTRDAAIEILGKIDAHWAQCAAAKEVLPVFLEALQSGDEHVRRSAALVLGQIRGTRALESLVAALADGNTGVQEAAASALGEIGDPRALLPLISALQQNDAKAPKVIAAAIVRIGEAIVQPLVDALKSKDARAREAAAAVLVRIGHSVVEPLVDVLWKIDPDWSKAEEMKAAMPQFVSALKVPGSSLLREQKEVLRKTGETRVIKPPAAAGQGPPNSLGKAAPPSPSKSSRDVESLSQALENPDLAIRKSAVDALREIGQGSEEPLVAALSSRNHVIRRAAAHALARRRDLRARDVLRCDLLDRSGLVILDAAESLLQIGDIVIVQPLLKLLKRLDSAREGAATTSTHTAQRIVRLLRRLFDVHAKELDLEDLEAVLSFQNGEKGGFVPSAVMKSAEPSGENIEGTASNDPAVAWSEVRERARRELNRRRVKAPAAG